MGSYLLMGSYIFFKKKISEIYIYIYILLLLLLLFKKNRCYIKCPRDRDSELYKSYEDTRTQKQSQLTQKWPKQNAQFPNRNFNIQNTKFYTRNQITQTTNTNQH